MRKAWMMVSLMLMFGCATSSAGPVAVPAEETMDQAERAQRLATTLVTIDGHVDLPFRLMNAKKSGETVPDPSKRTTDGDFDAVRAKAGGLDAPFMSIYIPAQLEFNGAYELANELIDMVDGLVATSPDVFAKAHSVADVRKNFEAGLISLPMGMENGAPIGGKIERVKEFHDRGIRYITLAHSLDNHISDSSYDDHHTHKGLSDFGKEVVAEMNHVGIMIDVSHISDDAFWQVVELSKVPMIASHSSCRHFTPGFERNMSDEMIVALAKKGGVIQINFGTSFLDAHALETSRQYREEAKALVAEKGLDPDSEDAAEFRHEFMAAHPSPPVPIEKVAEHIMHVVELVGVDHVGLGSDFDGVGGWLPTGLEDPSGLPALVGLLLDRGLSDEDIAKVLGENVLRVWSEVETYASQAT